jgi:hypothetical protein
VGSYSNCVRAKALGGSEWIRRQPNDYFVSRCWPSCGGLQAKAAGISCGASTLRTQHDNARQMERECAFYTSRRSAVDLSDEVLADLDRDAAKRWNESEYLSKAMGHKYCLVAQGDFPGTPKIAEMLAVGGAGGCLPIFVLKPPQQPTRSHGFHSGLAAAVRASLPFSRWLDYCSVSFLVTEAAIRRNASGVLDELQAREAAAPHEIHAKRQQLRRLRRAFGFWEGSSPRAPSATDFVFAELCAYARHLKDQRQQRDESPANGVLVAGSDSTNGPAQATTAARASGGAGGGPGHGGGLRWCLIFDR